MLKVWGCKAYGVLRPEEAKSKVLPRTMEGIYIGHEDGVKGYVIYKPRTRKVLTFCDARFEEDKPYYERANPKAPAESDLCIPHVEDHAPVTTPSQERGETQ